MFLVASAFAADIKVRDIPATTVLPAVNDYLLVDGATNGTSKNLLFHFSQIVATRAALAALTITNVPTNTSVYTLGGTAAGDGNGGWYYYDSASSATPDGVNVIQPTVGSGRWLISKSSALPGPTTITLGGVFSKAPVANQFLTSVGTDGTITSAQVTAGNISGLGTMSLQNSTAVSITGGAITGITDLAIADGGTGASTAATARSNLEAAWTGVTLDKTLNLSDLTNAATARTNLGVTATGADTTYAYRANNLSDLASIPTARANLGLSTMAQQSAASVAITGGTISGTTVGASPGTASTGRFTTVSIDTNANLRTTKGNLNLVVNVKDYGAVGNGTTSDSAALAAAWAALPASNGVLYFPPGKYRITSGIGDITGKTNLTVTGDGAELYNDTGAAGTNTLVFTSGCSGVTVDGLRFTGTSTVRGNGIHIRMYASNSTIINNYFQGCSDFAVHLSSSSGYTTNHVVANNTFYRTLGDGVHVGAAANVTITGNVFTETGDDAIGIVDDDGTRPPQRVTVTGNTMVSTGAWGVSGCGVRVAEAIDVLVANNYIYGSKEAGIFVGRYTSNTAYNARIAIKDNVIYDALNGGPGMLAALNIAWINQCTVSGNQIMDPANGGGIAFLDISETTISDNYIRRSKSRGIAADDGTTANVSSTWNLIYIINNTIDWTDSIYEGIYVVPGIGKTINQFVVSGNVGGLIVGGTFIYYDRVNTGRIWNNMNTWGAAVTGGGSVTSVTVGNNN